MTTKEKVAYLKGLIEGIDLDKNPKELKLFSAIIDVLDSLAEDVCEIEDTVSDMSEDLEDISDDLDCLGEYIFGEDEDDDDDDDYWFDDEDDEPVFYQVTCPACENTITIDEDILMTGAISCPNCGETLEFDLGSIEDIEDEDVNSDKDLSEPIAVDPDEDIGDLPF